MNTISVQAALHYGWDTFKKRPGFFIGMTVIIFVVSWVTGFILGMLGMDENIIGSILNLVVTTLLDLGIVATMLKVFESPESAKLEDLWHPQQFLPYLAATVLTGIIVVVGLILLIVPGVIAAIMLLFVKFIVVDRKLGPIEALKESARMTKGHRMTLFLLILAIAAINIIGAILLLIPLLVTIPVSTLAMVYTYRKLGHAASEVVPTPAATA
ncbi:MAG: DUF975 family protein [Candidatus Pacebacteria bacterium]|nr:DUF975 family protein [Candidatus Paceibacterota bacterium]